MRRGLASLVCALAACAAVLPAAASADTPEHRAALRALHHAQDTHAGKGVRTGRELSPALAQLFKQKGALGTDGRKQARALLARPTDGGSDPQGDGYGTGEATPLCGTNFCVHYVTSTADAPPSTDTTPANGVPDYVERVLDVMDNEVYRCENGPTSDANACGPGRPGLAWPQPVSDLGATNHGPDGKSDVYLKELGTSLFGYVAPDPQPNTNHAYAFLVLDDDYSGFGYLDPMDPLRVTAAHEYNHVLQFGMDAIEDLWMFESTATYMEEKVYPSINDYLYYLDYWANETYVPLTEFTPGDLKVYGSAVWNLWLDSRYGGDDVVQSAWEQSAALPAGYTDSLAPDAYRKAITDRGGAGFADEFEEFSAAVAEWNAPDTQFPDGTAYPDVERVGSLSLDAGGMTQVLDHTTFKLFSVPVPATNDDLILTATLPPGLNGAVALVGLNGANTTKAVTKVAGGVATARLSSPQSYSRITAVLVNADAAQSGWGGSDWLFTKDNQAFANVRAGTKIVPPGPGAVLSMDATDITESTARLIATVSSGSQPATGRLELGETTNYGRPVAEFHSSASEFSFGGTAGALKSGTTYHYRAQAINGSGTVSSEDRTFTTAGSPPTQINGTTFIVPPKLIALTATVGKGKLAAILKKGLRVRAGCGQACSLTFKLVVSKKFAKKFHLKRATVATAQATVGGTGGLVIVRFTKAAKKALRRAKTLKGTLTLSALDPAAGKISLTKPVSLKR